MKKEVTIKEYLKDEIDNKIKVLLDGYYLNEIPIEVFFKHFQNVERTPVKVSEFICLSLIDNEISYELAAFGSRESDLLKKKFYQSSCYTGINDNIDDEDYYYRNFFR